MVPQAPGGRVRSLSLRAIRRGAALSFDEGRACQITMSRTHRDLVSGLAGVGGERQGVGEEAFGIEGDFAVDFGQLYCGGGGEDG